MAKEMFTYRVEEGLAVVTFDAQGEPVNTWNTERELNLIEVCSELKKLVSENQVRGMIIQSGKPGTFLTGANLNDLAASSDNPSQAKADIELFQKCLGEVAGFPVPTLAAVWGHCLGGGLELALTCTARIAKEGKTTQFGLPELSVGVFPAGGGTSRLTRLIGYPAIDMVLTSENVDAGAALGLHLVDKVVGADADLLAEAKKFLLGILDGSVSLIRPEHDFSDSDAVIEQKRQAHIKSARGRLLPAPEGFLEVVQKGIRLSLDESMALEREYHVKVATSNETKGLVNNFFLTTYSANAKKFITKGYEPKEIKKAAVLGFGTMGRGIVIDILSKTGLPVVVKDMPQALGAGLAFVEKNLEKMAQRGRLKAPVEDLMKRILPTSEYSNDFSDVDIVIEAVFEDLSVKEEVFKGLCEVVREDCIIASNTSYLSVNELAEMAKGPERFAGLHFFSPVWRMALVEIVRGKKTSQNTVDDLLGFAAMLRKRPVICNDGPGFVVNNVLNPFMTSSIRYVEEGNPIEKVDAAMVKFGMPVGPIKLLDEVGIDVSHHIFKSLGVEQKTAENMYNAGRYGLKKNGKGFYLEDGSVDPQALPLIASRPKKVRTEEEIANAILTDQILNGKKLLDDHIVDDVRMIDMGMVFGAGYPADKGGPMKWADIIGLSKKLFGENFYKYYSGT